MSQPEDPGPGSRPTPKAAASRVRSTLLGLGSGFLVLVSAAIAFCATCFPIGLTGPLGEGGNTLTVAIVVGGISALGAGSFVAYLLSRRQRNRKAKGLEKEV